MPQQYDNMIVTGSKVQLRVNRDWFWFDLNVPPLGSGAMGTVYLGRNVRNSHDLVAIKRVNPRFSMKPGIRSRARLEANLAFRHPNLVEMIGLCEVGGLQGPMFIISRLVQGVTLENHVLTNFSNRPDRVTKIVRLMFPILEALDFIHEKGIVHLDIKPSNIMIENGCNVRLMDLGIAYTHEDSGPIAPGLLGTPGYAAPEQYISQGQMEVNFDARTDIYQLGATLYELLSGSKPYGMSGGSSMPSGNSNPSVGIPGNNNVRLEKIAGVPSNLMAAIGRALQLNPSERYSSAREFANALRQALVPRTGFWERLFG